MHLYGFNLYPLGRMAFACHLIDQVTTVQVVIFKGLNFFMVWEVKTILWVNIFMTYTQITLALAICI